MQNLSGKKVLITGAAVRVGAAIVRAFAAENALVTIHYNKSADAAKQLHAEIGGAAKGHTLWQCDLTNAVATEKMMVDVRPDVLVNCASGYVRKPFLQETEAEIQAMLDINFLAPLRLMKLFAAYHNESSADPNIINFVDQAITGFEPDAFGYLISKKALAEATKSAALALAPAIRVNAVAPGPVLPPVGMESSVMAKRLKRVPLHRKTDLDDLANTVLFLAKNASVTGEILFIDGGQHINETHAPAEIQP